MPRTLIDYFYAGSASIINTASIAQTSVQILPANPNRRGLTIYNNGANSVYLAFDTFVSSATHMSIIIPTFAHWSCPLPIYTGAMAAIRNAGTGMLMITELY
jgi:hypothetical protein